MRVDCACVDCVEPDTQDTIREELICDGRWVGGTASAHADVTIDETADCMWAVCLWYCDDSSHLPAQLVYCDDFASAAVVASLWIDNPYLVQS